MLPPKFNFGAFALEKERKVKRKEKKPISLTRTSSQVSYRPFADSRNHLTKRRALDQAYASMLTKTASQLLAPAIQSLKSTALTTLQPIQAPEGILAV